MERCFCCSLCLNASPFDAWVDRPRSKEWQFPWHSETSVATFLRSILTNYLQSRKKIEACHVFARGVRKRIRTSCVVSRNSPTTKHTQTTSSKQKKSNPKVTLLAYDWHRPSQCPYAVALFPFYAPLSPFPRLSSNNVYARVARCLVGARAIPRPPRVSLPNSISFVCFFAR